MESYYSSDEEIAWGPLTLREIKGDLKRQVIRKPNRRHTVHCSFEGNHKMEESLCDDVNNKLDLSKASTIYLTPNESLQTTTSNNNFLEKLSEVINVASSDLSEYASVLEDTGDSNIEANKVSLNQKAPQTIGIPSIQVTEPSDSTPDKSCINFFKVLENRETQYDIENFHQTLVNNTCILSDEEECKNEGSPLNESTETTDSEETPVTKEDDVITISDDSDSSVVSYNAVDYKNHIERNISLKKELDLEDYEQRQFDNDSEHDSSLGDGSFEQTPSDEVQYELEHDSGTSCHAKTLSEEIGQYKCSENILESPNVHHKLSVIRESSTSPIIVPDIDLAQFDDSFSKDESFQLNDTVEEMKRAVCQGLNYTMSDDENIENTPIKKESPRCDTFTISHKEAKVQTPCGKKMRSHLPKPTSVDKKQIKKASPSGNFKVPETRKLKPTPTKSCPSHLKNIVSPVALYIKSSPRFPLRQNVPEKQLSKVVTSVTNKGNFQRNPGEFPEFPEVVYKPSRNQIASGEKHIVIPPYMRKLNIKEGQVTKHEGRLRYDLDRSEVSRKLLQTDITNSTIDQSLLTDHGDISVLTNKQAFIK